MLPDRSVFNRTKIAGKRQNSKIENETFWVIFKHCGFSGRQPSYVILLHRNMEIEKVEHKVDDKWSTFCHVQFHFYFFQFLREYFLLNLGDEKWYEKFVTLRRIVHHFFTFWMLIKKGQKASEASFFSFSSSIFF